MQIATALNVHNDKDLVKDTLDSILTYMTKDIVMIVDAAGWEHFENFKYNNIIVEKGYWHQYYRCPYKNVSLCLKRLYELFPQADWYCYIEYDCLVTSDLFKGDLLSAQKNNIWLLANDIRYCQHHLPPMFNEILNSETNPVVVMLGCCVFYHKNFIKKLNQSFLSKFLQVTEHFAPGWFPDFHGYALEEEIFPTLALHYGGQVQELAGWDGFSWRGKYQKFPMRHPNPILPTDITPAASIIHPLKKLDNPIRKHYQKIRGKFKK